VEEREVALLESRVRRALGTDEGLFAEPILYTAEPKFDGLSIELVYEHGVLARASPGTVGTSTSNPARASSAAASRARGSSLPWGVAPWTSTSVWPPPRNAGP